MSELKFKIKQRVIIARVEGRPHNIYRVDAFLDHYSGATATTETTLSF